MSAGAEGDRSNGPADSRDSWRGERAITLIFQILAATFALVGSIFLLFPNGTVRTINAVGSIFRVFPPAPQSELRFWVSLAVSYMALVTVLAWLIQRDPRRYRHLMPVLAVGKFSSSFTCLLFFVFSSPAFLYLLNFLVDGSITLIALGCYAWLGLEERAAQEGPLSGTDALMLETLVDALLPAGGAFAVGARDTPVSSELQAYFCKMLPGGPITLALMLRALNYGPLLFGPRPARFVSLSADDRQAYLAGFERARFAPRRQLIAALKLVTMLHFYDYPQVQQAIHHDGSYLRDKLLAGPNAAYHRLRWQ